MRLQYQHLDVFADAAFQGNQLAVFMECEGLQAPLMQRIANEMAFPETTFVFPADAPDTDARVRIFTPSRELPMAGHPTIGTVFALATSKRISAGQPMVTLALGVGPTPVFLEWKGERLDFAWMKQPAPTFGFVADRLDLLASALGVPEQDIRLTGLPVQAVSCGVPFLFVPLATRKAVNRAAVDRAALRTFFSASGQDELPIFTFTLEPGVDDATAFSRMFAPLFGIPEDPATGGASGPLGAYLVHHGSVDAERAARMVSLQGVAMGRPSRIVISISTSAGTISDVRIGGTSVSMGSGQLEIPDDVS
jgi:trans-2,3-dihydro-3-hydroxyanthranilate isomerase